MESLPALDGTAQRIGSQLSRYGMYLPAARRSGSKPGCRPGAEPVALSPDGKWVAGGNKDEALSIWDVASGKEVCVLKEDASHVASWSVSRDGKWVVAGCDDGSVRFWDVASGKGVVSPKNTLGPAAGEERSRVKEHSGPVASVAFSSTGESLAAAWITHCRYGTRRALGWGFSGNRLFPERCARSYAYRAHVWGPVRGLQPKREKGRQRQFG